VGKAVRRNRAKRLIRAAMQPYLDQLVPGWDGLLIARAMMSEADFPNTQKAVLSLLRKARLIREFDAT
jgi:ribonuclease P protein component